MSPATVSQHRGITMSITYLITPLSSRSLRDLVVFVVISRPSYIDGVWQIVFFEADCLIASADFEIERSRNSVYKSRRCTCARVFSMGTNVGSQ